MKIYPMPKIEFDAVGYAVCLHFSFEYNGYDETIHISPISKQIITGSINNIQFMQAVQEWVKNWVINNFEGVEVPDTDPLPIKGLPQDSTAFITTMAINTGWSNYNQELFELNPNIIKVTE
jgi:hypothetical protein